MRGKWEKGGRWGGKRRKVGERRRKRVVMEKLQVSDAIKFGRNVRQKK